MIVMEIYTSYRALRRDKHETKIYLPVLMMKLEIIALEKFYVCAHTEEEELERYQEMIHPNIT